MHLVWEGFEILRLKHHHNSSNTLEFLQLKTISIFVFE